MTPPPPEAPKAPPEVPPEVLRKISHCPSLVIAGTGSGVGKTSIALGLVRALTRRGLKVQTFKVGPDFLDPTYLTLASGRTCYNLDTWMCNEQYVRDLFNRVTADADIAIIEGVMGMYDGASTQSSGGSTAQIASLLDAPVILVVNAWGVARSFAAMVKGFDTFESDHAVAGVIANRCGSQRHAQSLSDALVSMDLPPLVGALSRGALPTLESRHLGLVTADKRILPKTLIDQLADACESDLQLDKLQQLAGYVQGKAIGKQAITDSNTAVQISENQVRIGVAHDQAFHFYYADTLEQLEKQGAQIVRFSPLTDSALPADLDGLYFGGGYPEVHAQALSQNVLFLESLRDFAKTDRPVYAECGGLMYLSKGIQTVDGQSFAMAGLLPFGTQMLPRFKMLGYVQVTLKQDSLWGKAGTTLRGHEFHYSQIIDESQTLAKGWSHAYQVRRRRNDQITTQGFQRGQVLASYIHLHLASHEAALGNFLTLCAEQNHVNSK